MEVKMKCPHCNNEAPDTNYRCPNCGNVLKPDLDPSDFRKKTVKRSALNTNISVLAIIVLGLAVLVYAAFFRTTGTGDSTPALSADMNRQEAPRTEPGKNRGQPGNQTQQQPAQPDKVFENPFFKDTGEEKKDDMKPEIPTPKTSTPASGAVTGVEFSPGQVINSANPGEEISIDYYVQEGKTTIFDFYSDYCPPCRKISPRLERLDRKRDDIVVLKVDINRPGRKGIDWGSPVVRQYRIKFVPFFMIYDPSGRRTHEGRAAFYEVGKLLSSEGIR
jgi:thiol-disulfide isomerase/thioredoxin